MTRIILVRHGQTLWNLELKYQGHADIGLSPAGLEQAAQVAARLAGINPAAVYSSDLSRAFHTAQIIAAKYDLPVNKIPDLREVNFGEWEGRNYESINSQWPTLMGKLFTHPDEIEIPGGETFQSLQDRAMKAVEHLKTRHAEETILVVSHGATIRAILCSILHMPLKYIWNIKQDNTAVNIIEIYPKRAIVSLMNDTNHLAH